MQTPVLRSNDHRALNQDRQRRALRATIGMLTATGLLLTTSCETYTQDGALIGGLAGAGIGALLADDAGGALVGGALGAAAGAAIGSSRDRRGHCYDADYAYGHYQHHDHHHHGHEYGYEYVGW